MKIGLAFDIELMFDRVFSRRICSLLLKLLLY